MAVTQQALKTDDASRKTDKAIGKTKGGGAAKTSKRVSGGKTARKDGVERLRKAADKRVGRISEKLADLLEGNALKGDLASTKVLVGLAERKKPMPEPKKRRRGPSLPDQLAQEPEWEGPEWDGDEEGGDQGLGARD
jgi:hypothetical protein